MAIEHTIRKNGEGEYKNVTLTPIKAIRYHCLECVGFKYTEVDGCTSPNCALFPYRFGKRPLGFVEVSEKDEIIDSTEENG